MKLQKERDGFRLSAVEPKIQWASNPCCAYGYQAMETFTFTVYQGIFASVYLLFMASRAIVKRVRAK